MDDEIKDDEILEQQESEGKQEGHSDYKPVNRFDAAAVHHLSGMYQNWFWTTPVIASWIVPSPISRTV